MTSWKTYIFVLFLCFYFLIPRSVHAGTYQTTYTAEYTVDGDSVHTKMHVAINNLVADIYIKEFSLSLPNNFPISNIRATIPQGNVTASLENGDDTTKIHLSFDQPSQKSSQTDFTLLYDQKNIFKKNGSIYEIIIPSIEGQNNDMNVVLHYPENINEKISIAKPVPDLISHHTITWNHVKTKTIYAVMGESQLYQLSLNYHLKNTQSSPVYTDIALPPETEYQSIYVNKISPIPERVFVDTDGNYLARYTMKIGQSIDIHFEGVAQVFVTPQESMKAYVNESFQKNQQSFLTPKKYWTLPSISVSSSSKDIFDYIVNHLSYNYSRLNGTLIRLGAADALAHPDQAVCTEFTDGFVGLARQKGIFSREIEGYGFTDDQKLRPLSVAKDVLHAWPEYYDVNKQQWIEVDPTWQNTSGIDYFSSFDLNHIAFVIHGLDSVYPYPAGSYKITNSKDVLVSSISKNPKIINQLEVSHGFPSKLIEAGNKTVSLSIKNTGNTFIKNKTIAVSSKGITLHPNTITLPLIAPFEEQKFTFTYDLPSHNFLSGLKSIPATVTIQNDVLDYTEKIDVIQQGQYTLLLIIFSGIIGAISIGFFLSKKHDS